MSKKRYAWFSAGEVSGDLHAAEVVRAFLARHPDVHACGIAGPSMQEAGCQVLQPISELNVMGFGDVIASLGRIRRIEASVLAWCAEHRPEIAVLTDFSGFHMRLGRKLKAMHIPVLHYIAPKLWAWGDWRVKKLARSQDALACILPFEPAWFAERGIRATYVGNPSAFACRKGWDREAFCQQLGISSQGKILAVLPGSRRQELAAHLELLAEAVKRLRASHADLFVVCPVAPGLGEYDLQPLIHAGAIPIQRQHVDYALRADAAIAVSGTATLELGLWNVPTVLVYRTSAMTMFLARRLVGLQCAGLANIILDDQPVMPELIQEQCTVDNILAHVEPLLQGGAAADAQRKAFVELRKRLGDADPASGCADLIDNLMPES